MPLTTIPSGMVDSDLKLNSMTAVASTSGTSIDFTGIPAGTKRITVMLRGVSTNGATDLLVQIGSGSIQTTGYLSTAGYVSTSSANGSTSTIGFNMIFGNAAQIWSGIVTICNIGGNAWVSSHAGKVLNTIAVHGGGDVALSGVLDRVRLTTANGIDTFDAGTVNVIYE